MQILVRTDHNIEGHEKFLAYVETTVREELSRFSERLTHVEVHLSDENAGKVGREDKRCVIEARLEGRPPTAVTHDAETIEQSFSGALHKLEKAVGTIIAKLREH